MILGFLCMGVLALAVVVSIVIPLWRPQREPGVLTAESNLAVWRQEREEISREAANGALTPAEGAAALAELNERVARELASEKAELAGQRRPARVLAVTLSVAIIALSAGLYAFLGTPAALSPATLAEDSQRGLAPNDPRVIAMVAALSEKLKDHPEDARGWALLGRSQMVLQHYPEAVAAYQHALSAGAPDAQLLADTADAMAMAGGRSLEGKPAELISQALQVDPNNPKALELAGTLAISHGDVAAAIGHWERLRAQLPPDSDDAKEVDQALATLRSRLPGAIARSSNPGSASEQAAGAAPVSGQTSGTDADPAGKGRSADGISGQIDVVGDLAGRVALTDTVYIVARAVNWNSGGPRMPVAVLKFAARELPRRFALSDAQSMTPQAKLSAQSQVVIQARVSKSGHAEPQPGDLESRPATVKLGANDLAIVIDQVVH